MTERTHKTDKGTILPLLNLRGKDYLEVKYRIVWFREEHPDWSIDTKLISVTDNSAFAQATIRDETGRIIAKSHKFENVQGFGDFIEKAETGAIGRALALIGYGTQFCADELDEGKRIVDSPGRGTKSTTKPASKPPIPNYASKPKSESGGNHSAPKPNAQKPNVLDEDPGNYVITFGRKYKGKRLRDIPTDELLHYKSWLEEGAKKSGTSLGIAAEFIQVLDGYVDQQLSRKQFDADENIPF